MLFAFCAIHPPTEKDKEHWSEMFPEEEPLTFIRPGDMAVIVIAASNEQEAWLKLREHYPDAPTFNGITCHYKLLSYSPTDVLEVN